MFVDRVLCSPGWRWGLPTQDYRCTLWSLIYMVLEMEPGALCTLLLSSAPVSPPHFLLKFRNFMQTYRKLTMGNHLGQQHLLKRPLCLFCFLMPVIEPGMGCSHKDRKVFSGGGVRDVTEVVRWCGGYFLQQRKASGVYLSWRVRAGWWSSPEARALELGSSGLDQRRGSACLSRTMMELDSIVY